MLLPEKTIKYKTYLKSTLVNALQPVFTGHPDPFLQDVKVTLDFSMTREAYPAIVIRFFERDIKNIGVGHIEIVYDATLNENIPFKHYLYNGDIEFAIYALSSYDRDIMADALIHTIAFGDLYDYSKDFWTSIVSPDTDTIPDALFNFATLGRDTLYGFGETQIPTPWKAEDQLLYLTNYRVPIFGEFYSIPPDVRPISNITSVEIKAYITEGDLSNPDMDVTVR